MPRTIKSDAAAKETVIIEVRPQASESKPVTTKATASVAVVTESERLATNGVRSNALEKVGNRGWVQ